MDWQTAWEMWQDTEDGDYYDFCKDYSGGVEDRVRDDCGEIIDPDGDEEDYYDDDADDLSDADDEEDYYDDVDGDEDADGEDMA